MKSFKVAFMSVVAVAVLAGSSFAATWKLATIRPEGSPVDVEVRRLADEVRKGTDGRIDIQIYPASILGDYTVVQERVSVGSVEMSLETVSWQVDKRLSTFTELYLAKDWATAKANYSKGAKYTAYCEEILKNQNIKVLAYYPVYFGGIGLTKAPNFDTTDIDTKKNVKVRVPAMKEYEALANAFGYQPVPLPFSEFFTAAQTGMVEGMFGPGAESYYSNFKEIVKTFIVCNEHFECWPLMVNLDLYNELSEADRAVLDKAAAEFEERRWAVAEQETGEVLKKLEALGVQIVHLTPEQQAHFAEVGRKACWPVMKEVVCEKYYNEIMETIVLE